MKRPEFSREGVKVGHRQRTRTASDDELVSREAVVEMMGRDESADDEWTWKFTTRAADQFDSLDPHV